MMKNIYTSSEYNGLAALAFTFAVLNCCWEALPHGSKMR